MVMDGHDLDLHFDLDVDFSVVPILSPIALLEPPATVDEWRMSAEAAVDHKF